MPLRILLAVLAVFACAQGARADDGFGAIAMGRCVGDTPPPALPEQAPLDFRSRPDGVAELKALAFLGYKTSTQTGVALDPQGRPVTAAEVSRLLAPADFSTLRAPQSLWSALQSSGYRLDEKTCFLSQPGGKPLTYFDYLSAQRGNAAQDERQALEVLQASLAGLPPEAPVPKDVLARMKRLEQAGEQLPPRLARELNAAGATAGGVSRDARRLYVDQTKMFDGQAALKPLAEQAIPDFSATPGPAGTPAYVTSSEQRLGGFLASDVVAQLSKTPSGRRLLAQFAAKNGVERLPTFLVLKTNQRPDTPGQYGAYFDFTHDTMVLNHWQAESSLMAALSPAQRKAVGTSLSDPRALRQFLEQHPKERAHVIGDIDEIFYHELVHAWQDRRSRLDVALMRGILPGYDPLEKEYEAYRDQIRFDFEKARPRPDVAAESGFMPMVGYPLLQSYPKFTTTIERMYMSSFVGMLPLKDIALVQKERESTARTLIGDDLYRDAVEGLKLVGLWQGDAALSEAITDAKSREQAYRRGDLPALRAQAVGPLAERYEAEGHFDWAIAFLSAVAPQTPGLKAALSRWAAAAVPTWARAPKDAALDSQLKAISGYMVLQYAGALPDNRNVDAEYARDARLLVARELTLAKTADPASAKTLRQTAASWSDLLPKDDPLRAQAQAAGAKP